MSRSERLEAALRHALQPSVLQLHDESHMHSVPPGAESHFRVLVVSDAFAGLSRVARHRKVHRAAEPELQSGLHALSLQAFTSEEWQQEVELLESPACLGGGRSRPPESGSSS